MQSYLSLFKIEFSFLAVQNRAKEDSTLDTLAYFSYIFISGKNVVIAAGCLNNMTYQKKSQAQNRFL